MVLFGDKSPPLFSRDVGNNVAFSVGELSKKPFTYGGASMIAQKIVKEETFDSATIVFNKFLSAMSYTQQTATIASPEQMLSRPEYEAYEFEEDQRLYHIQDLFEFQLSSTLYYAVCENFAAELGARMNAMDSASKNASEMLKALNISYNRKRQAAITTELTEIISGAAAVQK